MAGMSAGAICWFESCTTDSFGPTLRPLDGGLGILDGSLVPALPRRAAAPAALPPARRRRHAARRATASTTAPRSSSAAGARRDRGLRSDGGAWRVEPDGAGGDDRDAPCRRGSSADDDDWAIDPRPTPRRDRLPRRSGSVPRRDRAGPRRVPRSPAPGGRRRHRLAPAGRHEARPRRRRAGRGRTAAPRRRGGARRAADRPCPGSSDRPSGGRSSESPRPAEDEQVEVQLARAPALAILPPERPLELLEGDEQGGRAGRRDPGRPARRARRRRCGIAGWSTTPTGSRDVQPRHGAEAGPRAARRAPGRPGRASPAASPRFAPRPM